jgi:hypothetical protein
LKSQVKFELKPVDEISYKKSPPCGGLMGAERFW